MPRRSIDWKKTGRRLLLLRNDNISLRRYVCRANRYGRGNCSGVCDTCKYDMDVSISRSELAKVFNVTESVVFNWENGITPVSLEDMLFYCEIADVALPDIIVFSD